jgi:hypothetical protein
VNDAPDMHEGKSLIVSGVRSPLVHSQPLLADSLATASCLSFPFPSSYLHWWKASPLEFGAAPASS